MNVNGLNSLGFLAPSKAAKGNVSAKGDSPSFEDVLAESGRESGSEGRPAMSAKPDLPKPVAERTDEQPAGAQLRQSSAGEQALPAPPSAPAIDRPAINDRMLNGPVNSPVAAGAGKQPVPPAQDAEVDNLTRRVVWNDFLRKMKDELGITAEDVLNAFKSLSAEDLAKPPQQSVDQVVMALGLDGQQAQVAKKYFLDLINKTQPRSLGEELANSQKQITLTLMSQRELSRRQDNQAVDRLQQQFFMKGAFQRPQDAVAAQPADTKPYIPEAVMDQQGHVQYVNPKAQDAELKFAPAAMAPSGASPEANPNSAALVQQMAPVKGEKPSADVDGLIRKFMAGQAQPQTAAAASPAAAVSAPSLAPQAAAPSTGAANAAQAAMTQLLSKLDSAMSSGAEQGEDSEYTSDASYLGAALGADTQALGQPGLPGEFQSHMNTASPGEPVAVPDLVQTAQVMVRDGGGEMKVTLTPEGLGEVAMKVSVQDGKVNVQMITESDEAKKLIERQLGELKTSLISQHLNVDSLKVETAGNISKQMEQQYQDAQRNLAQQTMEQFRQDHQGWRRSFFETPALKVYKGQTDAPRDIPAPASASSRRANNRRLDLVA